MPETQPSIFEEDFNVLLRKDLLPWWIIFFSWLFIIICPLQVIIAIIEYSRIGSFDLGIFSISPKTTITFKEALALANSLFTIVAAYGLLKEKDWAIKIAIMNGFVSVVETAYSVAGTFVTPQITAIFWGTYGFLGVLLATYLWKLFRMEKDWSIRQPRSQA
ncbi:hypothetical protein GFS24_05920 [Chitinophaga sp. SYP-B3965]|uniref:hypothetical protein n=1 Tax=Chitinophaga sp. SYP-B3965 TaxID=2663120 RepID=UPI001299D9DE|nr:hypothetical protein [Chitinophaga sp. SYP-B3965]MRG44640.1 hypothetical protein [Chitinophaga sp. SYP-B3965]